VGFVVTATHPFAGVDLDHCRDPETGKVALWAADIIRRLDSYTEVTPSGAGVRIWVRATLPPGGRKKGRIELYDRDRYFTITGAHVPGRRPPSRRGRRSWRRCTLRSSTPARRGPRRARPRRPPPT
jgi:primase-polymerase (primpol)-like protein